MLIAFAILLGTSLFRDTTPKLLATSSFLRWKPGHRAKMDGQPDPMEEEILKARSLPIDERVESKVWKVRKEAYDYIKEQCE